MFWSSHKKHIPDSCSGKGDEEAGLSEAMQDAYNYERITRTIGVQMLAVAALRRYVEAKKLEQVASELGEVYDHLATVGALLKDEAWKLLRSNQTVSTEGQNV